MLTQRIRVGLVALAAVLGVLFFTGVAQAGTTTHCTLTRSLQWICTTTTYTPTPGDPVCQVGRPC